MNTQPLISVLIPAYNVQIYVEEAINSLLTQTYQDFEIVIVDDCSTDNTLSLLNTMAKKDGRIKVFSKDKNSGIVDTLNYGLQFCKGQYIARMDADDIAHPDRLLLQINYLNEHEDVHIVGSSTMTISMDGEPRQISKVPIGRNKIDKTLKFFSPCFHIWLARVSVYHMLNGYRALAPAEDYDFLLRAVSHGFRIENIDQPLMKIRCRDGNTADVAGLKQRKAHDYVVKLYKNRITTHTCEDYFSPEHFQHAIESGRFEKKNYDFSIRLVKKGFEQKNKLARIFFFFFASFVSKWQFKYAFQRMIYKFYLK
jgi:glycosyltransferase involved in cell wall biosynthesis